MRAKAKRLIALMITAIMLVTNVLPVFAEDTDNVKKDQDTQRYKLTVEISGQGTVKVTGDETVQSDDDPEVYLVKSGSKVIVEITPADGYELSELKLDGEDITETFEMPEKDSALEVKLNEIENKEEKEEDAESEESGDTEKERIPAYDLDSLNAVLDSIDGIGRNENGIATFAAVGQNVNTTVLQMDVGTIDMIRYSSDGSWSLEGGWSEGILGTSNGEWAFCADPNVDFVAGSKHCYNANQFYSEATIKTIGMMFYYFDNYVDCGGLSNGNKYCIKQCIVWSVLDKVNGWLPGITLEYGNGMTDGKGHAIAGHVGTALYDAATWAADAENRKHFTCSGIIMKGNGQDMSQWTYNYRPQGKLQIHKSSAIPKLTDGNACYSLAGAVYGVYSDAACSNKAGELTTTGDGVSNVLTLDIGDYYVKEIQAPKGFAKDTKVYPVKVTTEPTAGSEAVVLSVKDYPQSDPIKVVLGKIDKETNQNKPQGSATLENAEFTVKYYDVQMDTDPAKSGKKPVRSWVLKTNDTGLTRLGEKYKVSGDDFYYTSAGDVTLPLGTVTIQETKAPTGYLINDTVYVRKITSAGDLEKVETYNEPTVPETPQKLRISLEKQDSETGATPQGEAVIDGAVYEVFDSSNQVVDTLTIKNGKAVSKELPLGKYTVKEKEAPEGYLLDSKIYTVNGEKPADTTTRVFTYPVTSKEDVIRGDVEIIKVKENQDEDNDTLEGLEGVEFTFTAKATGKVATKIVTDKDGKATTAVKGKRGTLPYGTYIVTETKYPEGLKPIEPFEVTIKEDSVVLKGIYKEDKLIVSPVSVVKKDKSSGMTIPVKDTEFQILDADKNPITMTTHYPHKEVHETFKTDENGQFTLPDKLKYGTYYLKEVQAPNGYLKGELLEFKVTKGATWENPLIVECFDDNAMGKIEIEKLDAENKEALAGATFEIIAAEDIMTPDGTIRAQKDTVVDTVVTDEDGLAESKELYLGKYLIREKEQPDGYLLLNEDLKVELTYKDQDTPVVVEKLEVLNTPTNLIVQKEDKDSKERLKGVKFSICSEKEHGQEGHKCKIYVTDKNGEIAIKRLSPGTYLVQEVEGLTGYEWDTSVHKITVGKDGKIKNKDIGVLTVDNAKTEITKTSVLDIASKSQTVYPKKIEAVDTVSLKNLQKGETYTLERELKDVETGDLLYEDNDTSKNPLTDKKEFEAADSKMDVEMEISFDAPAFAGRKIVVCEKLYQNGELISSHTDLNDEKQQLTIKNPKLHTTATDSASGTHEAIAKKDAEINDKVEYTDIIPGTYVLKGVVMDKKTKKPLLINKKEVTAEKEIEIKEDGTVDMKFTFDASKLNNSSVVIYEYLYKKGQSDKEEDELIASHEDINDEGQTVRFKVGGLKAKLPRNNGSGLSMQNRVKTGDQASIAFFILLMAVAGCTVCFMRKKLVGDQKSEDEKVK